MSSGSVSSNNTPFMPPSTSSSSEAAGISSKKSTKGDGSGQAPTPTKTQGEIHTSPLTTNELTQALRQRQVAQALPSSQVCKAVTLNGTDKVFMERPANQNQYVSEKYVKKTEVEPFIKKLSEEKGVNFSGAMHAYDSSRIPNQLKGTHTYILIELDKLDANAKSKLGLPLSPKEQESLAKEKEAQASINRHEEDGDFAIIGEAPAKSAEPDNDNPELVDLGKLQRELGINPDEFNKLFNK